MTSGAAGVRVLTGFGSIGGSFQFSVVFLGGGGGKSVTRESVGFVGCSPGLYGLYGCAGVYCDVDPDLGPYGFDPVAGGTTVGAGNGAAARDDEVYC